MSLTDPIPAPPSPIEAKVKAAAVGAGGSAAVITPAVVWMIDALWFNGDADPSVPLPLVGLVGLVVTGACAFGAGWWAKHTARPDLGRS
ncbi:hypothetical protein ACIBBG_31935 [Micromonospora chersina]|uniref:hypothetical protein n=1 Tax=Micromonospora chersina TaxID=47854 RepID=UPI003791E8A4